MDLSDSGFGDKGGTHIAAAIEQNRSITHLSLTGNKLVGRCRLTVSKTLFKAKRLWSQRLNLQCDKKPSSFAFKPNLRRYKLGPDTCMVLAPALCANTTLR